MTLDTGPHLVGYFKVRLTPETSALNLRFARDPSGMPEERKSVIAILNCRSTQRARCPIRPLANPDEEYGDALLRVIHGHNRRAWLVGSPAFRRVARDNKHKMRVPAPSDVA